MIEVPTPSAGPMTRTISIALALALIAAGCGSDAKTGSSAAPVAAPITSEVPAVASPPVTEPETTTPAISEPASTQPNATDAPGMILSSLEAKIRAAMAASLEPGFYTISPGAPADSLPSGSSIGIRVPGQPDLLIGVGSEATHPDAAFDPTALFSMSDITVNILFALYDMLVDEGTIDPNTPLSNWLPTYPNATRITFQMLRDGDYGGHGMAEIVNWVELVTSDWTKNWTLEEVLAEAAKATPGAIGTKGNGATAATALAFMIEKATGQTFAELVDSRFAKPLGLHDTRIIDAAALPSNFSHGRFNFNGTAHTTADFPLNSYMTFNVAHSSLLSTLSDQLTLLRAMSTGTVPGLHRLPTPDKFKADHLLSDSDGDRYVGDKFPLNLHCPCQAAGDGFTGTAIGRRANDIAALTHWYYFPKADVAIVIHNNSNEEATPLEVMNLVYRIYGMVSGDVVPATP